MKYVDCPLCGGNVSEKTIIRTGRCNNCYAEESLLNLLDHDSLAMRHRVEWKVNLIISFNDFIESSSFSRIFKYRIVVDFQKVINRLNDTFDSRLSESWLNNVYYDISAYKSPKYLDIIKVFFFSQSLIAFDVNNYPWSVTILDNWYYYNEDILDYYFDDRRCHDCGVFKGKQTHNFCETCTDRRSLKRLCSKSTLEKTFESIEIKNLFLDFVNFMLKSQLQFRTVHDVSNLLVHVFIRMEKLLDSTERNKIISFSGNTLQEKINIKWICSTFESYTQLSMSSTNLRKLPAAYGHFCAFLHSQHILSPDVILPYLRIEGRTVEMFISDKNDRTKIEERILSYPSRFRKLLNYYLEMKSKKIYVLEKKNAVKTLEWKSVTNLFGSFFKCIDWLMSNYQVEDWLGISQEMINSYLLIYNNQQHRDIEKRKLYNLFEFGQKNKLLLANPIPPFKARSYNITKKIFNLKDHVLLNQKIKISSLNNPTDSLLVSLCYFHVLTSKQIRNIRLSDIDANRKAIFIDGRPPAYLDDSELRILNNHLKLTQYEREFFQSSLLFFNIICNASVQVTKEWVLSHTKKLVGYPPSDLRHAGLQYCAEVFGPEYLHDCFGVSLTHAARFGNPDDWIIEDIISDEIENVVSKNTLHIE